eukprot:909618-Rhodomonas_salina.1
MSTFWGQPSYPGTYAVLELRKSTLVLVVFLVCFCTRSANVTVSTKKKERATSKVLALLLGYTCTRVPGYTCTGDCSTSSSATATVQVLVVNPSVGPGNDGICLYTAGLWCTRVH